MPAYPLLILPTRPANCNWTFHVRLCRRGRAELPRKGPSGSKLRHAVARMLHDSPPPPSSPSRRKDLDKRSINRDICTSNSVC